MEEGAQYYQRDQLLLKSYSDVCCTRRTQMSQRLLNQLNPKTRRCSLDMLNTKQKHTWAIAPIESVHTIFKYLSKSWFIKAHLNNAATCYWLLRSSHLRRCSWSTRSIAFNVRMWTGISICFNTCCFEILHRETWDTHPGVHESLTLVQLVYISG